MSFGVSMGHHEEAHIASHLLASIPHGRFAEAFHPDRDPIYWGMLANRPKLKDGTLALPSTPGWGWELDEVFISSPPGRAGRAARCAKAANESGNSREPSARKWIGDERIIVLGEDVTDAEGPFKTTRGPAGPIRRLTSARYSHPPRWASSARPWALARG